MIVDFCVFTSWDNGEIEKLSPWDVEPISDDGNEIFLVSHCCHVHTQFQHWSRGVTECVLNKPVSAVQPRSQRQKEVASL